MAKQNTKLGIVLMLVAGVIFAISDGVSRYLVQHYSPMFILTLRYWFFGAFVLLMAWRSPQGFGAIARTEQPVLQIFRGVLLAGQVCMILYVFKLMGLINAHAIFAAYPLIAAALSVPILGEKVGIRRWSAILVGLVGVLIILQPNSGAISPPALLALASAALFALYGLATRYVGRRDSAVTSLFYTGVAGAVVLTPFGLWTWQAVELVDLLPIGVLCCSGLAGHFVMIKAYEVAEASAIQPLAYLQLVHISLMGILIFGEVAAWNVVLGASIVVAAGVFTILRGAKVAKMR